MKSYQLFTCLALFSAAVLGGPHFQSIPTSSVSSDNGALTVTFDEAGLGNGDINYSLEADSVARFQCFNKGGKHPQAGNKETVNSEVATGATFKTKNGRVQASISSDPPSQGAFTCPPGQTVSLVSAAYTNIVLTDTTNGISTSVPDASRTFISA
jgi:hypothetical protein